MNKTIPARTSCENDRASHLRTVPSRTGQTGQTGRMESDLGYDVIEATVPRHTPKLTLYGLKKLSILALSNTIL